MNLAEQLEEWTKGLCAWNMPHSFKLHLVAEHRNQHATVYVFNDGSRARVWKGTAKAHVVSD